VPHADGALLHCCAISAFSYFLNPKRASIHEDYYSAAVDNGEELFTFTFAGIIIDY